MIVMSDANVMFSTEPSNMLDVPSITFLSDYLQDYPSTVLGQYLPVTN